MKVFIKGQGSISLRKSDFLAQGGEGSIYVKGDVAFKIYSDPKRMIAPQKIRELSAITDDRVITPQALILASARGRAIGYTMRHVAGAWPLCRLFAKTFKERHKLDAGAIAALCSELAARIRSVHAAGALVVDCSEMNFLVDAQLKAVFAIDVDSYQTPSYPATAITPTIRDPRTDNAPFDQLSDWYAFAVIATQLFIGVHPYRGKHPDVQGIAARMQQHVSIFDGDVRLPKVAYPTQIIPSKLRSWLESVLQQGQRSMPPSSTGAFVVQAPTRLPSAPLAATAAAIEEKRLHRFPSRVRVIWGGADRLWTVTDDGLYREATRLADTPPAGSHLCVSPAGKAVLAYIDAGRNLVLVDVASKLRLQSPAVADAITASDGRLYIKSGDKILELLLRDVGSSVIASTRLTATVLPHATALFDGVAAQNLLGACYLSLFPKSGVHVQLRVHELDGRPIIDAAARGRVAMLLTREGNGYARALVRTSDDGSYDIAFDRDCEPQLPPFVCLDSGVGVRLRDDDSLELFAARPDKEQRKVVPDSGLSSVTRMASHRGQVLCARGNDVLRLSTV